MSHRASADSGSDKYAGQRVEVLQSLLDQVTDGVVAVDRDGKPIAFNSAAVRILRMDLAQTTVAQWIERSTLLPVRRDHAMFPGPTARRSRHAG